MNYCIVYWSRFGHNKKIVNYLKETLTNKNHSVQVFQTNETDPASLPASDLYIFSASAEAFRIQKDMRSFMKKLKGIDGKKYGIINTHAMKNRNWLGSMHKILTKKNMVKQAEIDFHIGEGQKTGEGLPDNWTSLLDGFINNIQ